jgi:diguanylate cyclase (GGDEF)-like protein/PAS domain S-box-containing protein
MWEVDKNGVYTYVSPQCVKILGYQPEELIGQTPFDLMPAQEATRVAALFQEIVSTRRSFANLENTNLHREGYSVILETSGKPFFDANGELLGYRGTDRDISYRRKAEQALEVTLRRCQMLIDFAPDALIALDLDTLRFIDANQKALELFGLSKADLLKTGPLEISPGRQADGSLSTEKVKKYVDEVSEKGQASFEWTIFNGKGDKILCDVSVAKLPSAENQNILCCSLVDISQRKLQEAKEISLGRIIEASLNEIYIFNEETLLFIEVNRGARQNLGYSLDELRQLTPLDLKPEYTPSTFNEMLLPLRDRTKEILVFETVHKRKDGTLYNVEVHLQLIPYGNQLAFVAIILDITERIKAQAKIKQLAFNDPLTGLPNRRLFLDRLSQELSEARRREHISAVLFMDLDNFKILNDSFGHSTGDALLIQAARRMSELLRDEDTVARQGGDEFVLLLKKLDKDPREASELADVVANKILEALALPFKIEGQKYFISVSIGISLFPETIDSSDAILKRADIAMYKAKVSDRKVIHFSPQGDILAKKKDVSADRTARNPGN